MLAARGRSQRCFWGLSPRIGQCASGWRVRSSWPAARRCLSGWGAAPRGAWRARWRRRQQRGPGGEAFLAAPLSPECALGQRLPFADTFETACTWERFPELSRAIRHGVRAALKEHCGAGHLMMRFTHVYPDGPPPTSPTSRRCRVPTRRRPAVVASDGGLAGDQDGGE